jgi:hypothetical protein
MSQKVLLVDRDGGVRDTAVADQPVTAVTLGALGEVMGVALLDGRLCCVALSA